MPDFVFALVAHGKPLTEINAHPGLQVYREGRVVELPEGRGWLRLPEGESRKAEGKRCYPARAPGRILTLGPLSDAEQQRNRPWVDFLRDEG